MAYKYREVLCPMCDHRFMFNNTSNPTYEKIGDAAVYFEAKCPKCAELMLVSNDKQEGLLLSDIPEDMLKYHLILT